MKRKLTKSFALTLIFAMITLMFTACAGEISETPGNAGTESVASDTGEPAKDTLIISMPVDNDTVDTINATAVSILMNMQIYESLIKIEPDGSLVPSLAEEWVISEDEMTITFTLRQGVKFHNGETLTADDVVFSWERLFASPYIGAKGEYIDSVEAIDENTVALNLNVVYSPILEYIASVPFAILNREAVEAAGGEVSADNVVGTGPYMLNLWASGEKTELSAFEEYWQGSPSIKTVTWLVQPDRNAATIALENGEVDMIYSATPQDLARFETMPELAIHMVPVSIFNSAYINCSDGPLSDKRVRQAMAYAMNKEEIAYGVMGDYGQPADTLMTTISPYYNPDIKGYETDIEKAKALLSEAGYPDGFSLTFSVVPVLADLTQAAEIYQVQLAEIGIIADFKQLEYLSFVEDVMGNKNFDVIVIPAQGFIPDPDSRYSYWLSNNDAQNYNQYKSEEYDAAVLGAQKTFDFDERKALYDEASRIMIEDAFLIPVYSTYGLHVASADLKGVEISQTNDYFIYNFSW